MLLQAENITFAYQAITALKDVNFSLNSGEIVGIIGPNGAGKSTLLKIISGIISPLEGNIRIKTRLLSDYSRRELAEFIAYLPQEQEYNFDYKVMEFVLMGRFPYLSWWRWETQTDYERAWENMRLVKVEHLAERSLFNLSGGERQRVNIARALTQGTQILVLDEPVSHLDINFQIDIMELLLEIKTRKQSGIVLSLHDLNLASLFCERLILLKEGKVFFEGTPREVITSKTIEASFGAKVTILNDPQTLLPLIVPQKV
jgi:iron complex transport system ATP-binding protein